MVGYLVSRSHIIEENPKPLEDKTNIFTQAGQKASVALLGFTIARFLLTFAFNNLIITLPKFFIFCITGFSCAITLLVHALVSQLSREKYTAGWFFVALVWGMQDAILSGKFETDVINSITEVAEEALDSFMILRIIGILIVGFMSAGMKDQKPIGMIIPLIIVCLASIGITFLGMKEDEGKGEGGFLVEPGRDSSKNEEPQLGNIFSSQIEPAPVGDKEEVPAEAQEEPLDAGSEFAPQRLD